MITEDNLYVLTEFASKKISEIRKLKQLQDEFEKRLIEINKEPSSPEDMLNDWYNGSTIISSMILHGKQLSFPEISPTSYVILEDVWLKDIKLMDAYFLWFNNPGSSHEENYYSSCEKIRELLFKDCKHSSVKFDQVENYISNHFLKDGKINFDSSKTQWLINRKEQLLNESNEHADSKTNWFRAKLYAEMFYENIIPAITGKKVESICEILRAFQLSKSSRKNFLITNAFEAAISTAFLDNKIINELVRNQENVNFNIIPIDEWQNDLRTDDICRGKLSYDEDAKLLMYRGTMSENEKEYLKNILFLQKHKEAVEELYNLSTLEPLDKMIL